MELWIKFMIAKSSLQDTWKPGLRTAISLLTREKLSIVSTGFFTYGGTSHRNSGPQQIQTPSAPRHASVTHLFEQSHQEGRTFNTSRQLLHAHPHKITTRGTLHLLSAGRKGGSHLRGAAGVTEGTKLLRHGSADRLPPRRVTDPESSQLKKSSHGIQCIIISPRCK